MITVILATLTATAVITAYHKARGLSKVQATVVAVSSAAWIAIAIMLPKVAYAIGLMVMIPIHLLVIGIVGFALFAALSKGVKNVPVHS